jgi:hypothetical protein
MLDALFELIFEFISEFVFQLVIAIGFEWLAESLRRRPTVRIVLSCVVIPLFGALVGFVLSNTIPRRIFPRPIVPGVSLLLSPEPQGW